MSIVGEIARTLLAMFLADARLTLATLMLVALVAGLVAVQLAPLLCGAFLVVGCAAILLEAAIREARRRRPLS